MSFDLKGRRVFLTGGNGFLGRSIRQRLEQKGANVLAPRHAELDLLDPAAVRSFLATNRPEMIVHAAAVVGGIGANLDHPGSFFRDNALMGIHLIEEARLAGIEKFVCLGTICAYPKFAPVPFREDDLWSGYPEETNAPYGLAKKMLLVQLQAYRTEFGFRGIYLLPVNLYGPRDNFDLHTSHVIPAMIRKFHEARLRGDRSVTLWGDGSPTREFLYVEDAAAGIVLAAEQYEDTEPVNLGTGRDIRIADLARLVADAVGFEGEIVWDASRPNGQPQRRLDVTRARDSFGFNAAISLEDGIRQTVEWFRARD